MQDTLTIAITPELKAALLEITQTEGIISLIYSSLG
jgi:hypothetical protein